MTFLRLPFLLLWLTAIWVGFWGDLTIANVASGLVVAVVVVLLLRRSGRAVAVTGTVRPLAAVWFIAVFVVELVKSNLRLAYEIVTWRDDSAINTAIVAVPLPGATPAVATVVANAVTLTPGTLTVEVRDHDDGMEDITLYVHVLYYDDVEHQRGSVLRIYELVNRAFGPPTPSAPPTAPPAREVGT